MVNISKVLECLLFSPGLCAATVFVLGSAALLAFLVRQSFLVEEKALNWIIGFTAALIASWIFIGSVAWLYFECRRFRIRRRVRENPAQSVGPADDDVVKQEEIELKDLTREVCKQNDTVQESRTHIVVLKEKETELQDLTNKACSCEETLIVLKFRGTRSKFLIKENNRYTLNFTDEVDKQEESKLEEPVNVVSKQEEVKLEKPVNVVSKQEEVKLEEPVNVVSKQEEVKLEEPVNVVSKQEEVKLEELAYEICQTKEIDIEGLAQEFCQQEVIKFKELACEIDQKEDIELKELSHKISRMEEINFEGKVNEEV